MEKNKIREKKPSLFREALKETGKDTGETWFLQTVDFIRVHLDMLLDMVVHSF